MWRDQHLTNRTEIWTFGAPKPEPGATRTLTRASCGNTQRAQLFCWLVFRLHLLLLLLWLLLQRFRRRLALMGGGITRLERQPQLRVPIRLISKTQESLRQVFKVLAKQFMLLRPGEHIGCLKAVCISRPRHQRSPTASANESPVSNSSHTPIVPTRHKKNK